MNRKTSRDRLSPPLMHAFRSAHAEGVHRRVASEAALVEKFEAGEERRTALSRNAVRVPITEQALREEVSRDLSALVNTISLESAIDMGEFAAVRRSILNFGIRDLSARFADQANNGQLVKDVEEAILLFEPRLLASSIQVSQIVRVDEPSLTVRLEISADLQCEPINVPVVFVADIDVDSCNIAVSRAG
jgi:type VI secretion system protein ImpF